MNFKLFRNWKNYFACLIIICEKFNVCKGFYSAFASSQPEPFFVTFALYDARESSRTKLSEDFHFDPNSTELRSIILRDIRNGADANGVDGSATPEMQIKGINKMLLYYPSQVR